MKEIYTDGSCKGNPGPGAWAAIVIEDNVVVDVMQSELFQNTTNNRMEMSAILWAMDSHGSSFGHSPILYTDSAYAMNCFTTWINSWKKNGWKKSDGNQIENLDLIMEYDKLDSAGYQVDIKKISGHSGHKWNELADQLATRKITPKEILDKYGR